jgi:hypothetical protein
MEAGAALMYPLHSAQLRLAVLRLAANRAVDRAMRRLHDGPDAGTYAGLTGVLIEGKELVDPSGAFSIRNNDRIVPIEIARAESSFRFHERMKVDESNCRWCGEAAAEARAELENEDD